MFIYKNNSYVQLALIALNMYNKIHCIKSITYVMEELLYKMSQIYKVREYFVKTRSHGGIATAIPLIATNGLYRT